MKDMFMPKHTRIILRKTLGGKPDRLKRGSIGLKEKWWLLSTAVSSEEFEWKQSKVVCSVKMKNAPKQMVWCARSDSTEGDT